MNDELLEVEIEVTGVGARIGFIGEIDDTNVADVARALRQVTIDAVHPVAVDLSAVTYLGSAGVRALVDAAFPCSGAGIELVAVSDIVRRVLELSGLAPTLLRPAAVSEPRRPTEP